MGRITHDKRTQNPKKSTEIKIKTCNKVLNSLSCLKQTQENDNCTSIPHIEIFSNVDSINSIYNTLSEFSELSQKIIKWYDDNELTIKNSEQLTSDMLHDFELNQPKDLYRAYKCYKQLRESRQLRRKAKTENKMLYPLYSYIKSNQTLPKDLRSLNERCAGIQYDINHAQYNFKSNLKID